MEYLWLKCSGKHPGYPQFDFDLPVDLIETPKFVESGRGLSHTRYPGHHLMTSVHLIVTHRSYYGPLPFVR